VANVPVPLPAQALAGFVSGTPERFVPELMAGTPLRIGAPRSLLVASALQWRSRATLPPARSPPRWLCRVCRPRARDGNARSDLALAELAPHPTSPSSRRSNKFPITSEAQSMTHMFPIVDDGSRKVDRAGGTSLTVTSERRTARQEAEAPAEGCPPAAASSTEAGGFALESADRNYDSR
jgi:hypothetical protein